MNEGSSEYTAKNEFLGGRPRTPYILLVGAILLAGSPIPTSQLLWMLDVNGSYLPFPWPWRLGTPPSIALGYRGTASGQ